jgi:3-methyladenine DNA glycosylase AlkD
MIDRYNVIMSELKSRYNPKNIEGMKQFGINDKNTLGISVTDLRRIANKLGMDHELARKLWSSGVHEARLLAGMIDDPEKVTSSQMDHWTDDFDSWDICDQCCSNLFDKTQFAYHKANIWCRSDKEYVKRAGYVMMAALSVHDKKAGDNVFVDFLPVIRNGATDERNFVKKAVNWALRQIGKRNAKLNKLAIKEAEEIGKIESASAKWIAADALRELKSDSVKSRLGL